MSKTIIYFLFTFLLLSSSCATNTKEDVQNTYIVKYTYINKAVSPTTGIRRYELLIKNSKVLEVLDLKYGNLISKKNVYGIDEVLTTLPNNIPPYIIEPLEYITIYVLSKKKVKNNYYLSVLKERKKELKENYKKWISHNINYYIIKIQDSTFNNKYPEGVELTIKNNKVIKAKDIRTYQEVEPDSSFLTVDKLFNVAKRAIKDGVIDYHLEFKYPSFIKISNRTINAYYLKPLR